MKKILILAPYPDLPGGVNNYISLLTKNMDKEKIEVKLFYTGKTNSNLRNYFYPFLILKQNYKLKKIIKNFKPEIVHMNPSLSSAAIFRDFFFLKTIKRRNLPVLFFIHGWQKKISKKFELPIFRSYYKKRFNKADAIIVLAEEFKEELIHLGIDSEKLFVSSTMVESVKYHPDNKEFNKPFTVLFCATIKKEKGPFAVLNAVPNVLSKFPETNFLFIGSGKDLDTLKQKTNDMSFDHNVHFTGYISEKEKQEYFKKSHIFVFPTQHGEGFPTVILEAMASGMPLITTAVAGLKNALKNGKQGLMIISDPPESKEISQKIIQLLGNEKYMEQISENNINEAKNKYDVDVVTKEIYKIYELIVHR